MGSVSLLHLLVCSSLLVIFHWQLIDDIIMFVLLLVKLPSQGLVLICKTSVLLLEIMTLVIKFICEHIPLHGLVLDRQHLILEVDSLLPFIINRHIKVVSLSISCRYSMPLLHLRCSDLGDRICSRCAKQRIDDMSRRRHSWYVLLVDGDF